MLFPQSVIQGFKTVAEAAGTINEGQRNLMELLDPQNKNTFEVIFTPNSTGTNALQIAKISARIARDILITRLHLQTLSFGFDGTSFESADTVTYVKMMERVNEVTMTFIENDLAIMRNYIMDWQEDVVKFNKLQNNYIFKEDQEFAKRNCKIFLQMGSQVPSPGWITIHGLRPKKIGDLTIGHAEGDPWFMEVTFTCDYIKLDTLLQLL